MKSNIPRIDVAEYIIMTVKDRARGFASVSLFGHALAASECPRLGDRVHPGAMLGNRIEVRRSGRVGIAGVRKKCTCAGTARWARC